MKVLKRIVTIVVMVCVCIAFGGIKVAEAATCPPHGTKKTVGSLKYYETTSHSFLHISEDLCIDPDTGEVIYSVTYRLVECYSTANYCDVTEICTSCGAITGKWNEKIHYLHTNPLCDQHRTKPIRTPY